MTVFGAGKNDEIVSLIVGNLLAIVGFVAAVSGLGWAISTMGWLIFAVGVVTLVMAFLEYRWESLKEAISIVWLGIQQDIGGKNEHN